MNETCRTCGNFIIDPKDKIEIRSEKGIGCFHNKCVPIDGKETELEELFLKSVQRSIQRHGDPVALIMESFLNMYCECEVEVLGLGSFVVQFSDGGLVSFSVADFLPALLGETIKAIFEIKFGRGHSVAVNDFTELITMCEDDKITNRSVKLILRELLE